MKGLTDIEALRVGHMSDFDGVTGCTVVLYPLEGAVAGVDVRGVQQEGRGRRPLPAGLQSLLRNLKAARVA